MYVCMSLLYGVLDMVWYGVYGVYGVVVVVVVVTLMWIGNVDSKIGFVPGEGGSSYNVSQRKKVVDMCGFDVEDA